MKIPILFIHIILLGYPLGVFAQETGNTGSLMHELESHFANHFDVKDDAVHLRMIHEPKQLPKQPFSIVSQHGTRLGHQTLWLVEKESGKKSPVTFQVSIDLSVLAATRKISRSSDLNTGNVKRSEEHTSELQSHSFISYAVFCLKKKNNLPINSFNSINHTSHPLTTSYSTS